MLNSPKQTTAELEQIIQRLSVEHAEQSRQLEAINTVNNIVINSTSLDQMLDSILSEFLNLFDCQRAWLLYPCDPSAQITTIPKEKTRPEWPGASVDVFEIHSDDYTRKVFSHALASNTPVAYDSEKRSVASVTNNQFNVESMIVFAIHPKVDQPWLLGIHHCGKERIYNDNDIELFQALGGRITDGLSSILSLQKIQKSEAMQRALLNNTKSAISIQDLDGNYLLTNDYYNKIFNSTGSKLTGKNINDLFPFNTWQLINDNRNKVIYQKQSQVFEEDLPTTNGIRTFISERSPIFNNNEVDAICTIATDITARRRSEEKINHLAHYDYLTQLPNRLTIDKELKKALALSLESNKYGALIFIDLDNFKTLNDTKGHSYGDKLLKDTAKLLLECIRDCDTVARFGGDEFLIILPYLDVNEEIALDDITLVAHRVLSSLQTVFIGDDFQHRVTASIGIAMFLGDEITAEELFKRADSAMYQAKNSGRNNFKFFDPSLQRKMEYLAKISSEIVDAILNNDFELYYQPQVNACGRVVGAEALIRWNHPEKGLISPADFIPLAEENNSIIDLGKWVIQQGWTQLLKWKKNSLLADLTLSVNVSAKQFHQESFVENVMQIMATYGEPLNNLKMELTESLDQVDVEGNAVKMKALRLAGIYLSLDDFGTGFSSLSCLSKLPLNQLKIDQSFVKHISHDESSNIITKTIIGMAHNLKMDVIAEGVETHEQRDFLLENGCKHFQGYLYSKPLPVTQFEKLLLATNGTLIT
jgi:diguanylate cyclase (GGDEF)-like protein/PAS domain S-box-containing protein